LRIRHARLRSFRRMGLSALGVIGGCFGVYTVLAVAFHALVEPSLGKSYAAYPVPAAALLPPAPVAALPQIEATPRPALAAAAGSETGTAAINPATSEATPTKIVAAKTVAANSAADKSAAVEIEAAAKTAVKPTASGTRPTASGTRHRRYARDRRNPFDFMFGASFGRRRWF
jgi:hypothetical protein